MQGRFEVDTGDVTSASAHLSGVTGQLAQATGQLRTLGGGAGAAPGAAGLALAGLVVGWQGAIDRLAEGTQAFARDTHAAAALYQQADDSCTVPAPHPSTVPQEQSRSALWHALAPQPVEA